MDPSYYNDMFPNGTGGYGGGYGGGNALGSQYGGSDNGGSSGGFGLDDYLQSGMIGGALGSIASGLMGMGAENPSQAAMPYEQNALNQLPGYYQPYINAGQGALTNLQGQYGQLLNNPGGMLNQIGSSFHQSPGFQFALRQAMMQGNQSAAAGGMAGSPMGQQTNMGIATQMGNQNYYNYLQKALGMYGHGLQGEQGLYGIGAGAANNLGTNMSDIYNNMAQIAYAGQNQQNKNQGSGAGGMMGGIGEIASLASMIGGG